MTSPSLAYLSKLTLRRIWNIIKLYSGYIISRITGTVIHLGMPASITVEPASLCNLSCPECPAGMKIIRRSQEEISFGTFRKIIDELHKDASYLLLYFQGEPFLHPELLKMISYSSSKKLFTVTSTNGHFIDVQNAEKLVESGLDMLVVSTDGTTQEVYEKYRKGGNLETVKQGIRNLVKAKKEKKSGLPFIVLQFLVMKHNEHQMEEIVRVGNELGVDFTELKSAQFYNFENGHPMLPVNKHFSRYAQAGDGKWKIKSRFPNHCWRIWSSAVVTTSGDVVPCCFDKEAQYIMGNIKEHSFKEIWNGEKYRNFRKQLLNERKQIAICRNCTEGLYDNYTASRKNLPGVRQVSVY
jgi:radical SAM protein with 4Fe4S-binding SPASM domain